MTRNRHGNYEHIVSNDVGADLTILVLRQRSRWPIEIAFRDTKQFAGLEACRARPDQTLVRHVAFVLLTFVVLEVLRRHPEGTPGAVRECLQLGVVRGHAAPSAPLRAKAALLSTNRANPVI